MPIPDIPDLLLGIDHLREAPPSLPLEEMPADRLSLVGEPHRRPNRKGNYVAKSASATQFLRRVSPCCHFPLTSHISTCRCQ